MGRKRVSEWEGNRENPKTLCVSSVCFPLLFLYGGGGVSPSGECGVLESTVGAFWMSVSTVLSYSVQWNTCILSTSFTINSVFTGCFAFRRRHTWESRFSWPRCPFQRISLNIFDHLYQKGTQEVRDIVISRSIFFYLVWIFKKIRKSFLYFYSEWMRRGRIFYRLIFITPNMKTIIRKYPNKEHWPHQ